jgi:cytidine deaminase
MTPEVRELIDAARRIQGMFSLTDDLTAGSVGAALRTQSGKTFSGICVDVTCGLGICAERAAIAEMLKSRETAIDLIVAIGSSEFVPPCGCCREFMIQIDRRNLDTRVIIAESHIVRLRDLLPLHWLTP